MLLARKVSSAKSLALSKIKSIYSFGSLKLLKLIRILQPKKNGINLIGFFSYTFGVAEVGRFFSKRIKNGNLPFSIIDVPSPVHKKIDDDSLAEHRPYFRTTTSYRKNIFFINADYLVYLRKKDPKLFIGRYNAAVFFWEFDDYFYFTDAFNVVNEVITFTNFIATAIKKAAPPHIKVTKLSFPFVQNWTITKSPEKIRKQLSIADDEFVFIFNFDFHSVYERKNPEALLNAFELAFSPMDKVRLVLKTIHAEAGGESVDRFKTLVNRMHLKEKVQVIDQNLERNEFMSILNACDCYISLHRSEGLGLGMLEAMSMGKPVIATRFGGNLDFMTDDNSLLVDYRLVPIEQDAGPYKAGWLWAEADIDQASAHMHELYSKKNFAFTLGKRAKDYILSHYNADAFLQEIDLWMKD